MLRFAIILVCIWAGSANVRASCEDPVPKLRESVVATCGDGLVRDTCKSLYRGLGDFIRSRTREGKMAALKKMETSSTPLELRMARSVADARSCVQYAPSVKVEVVTVRQLYRFLSARRDRMVILDVRTSQEFDEGRLPGARNYDYFDGFFADDLAKLQRDKTYAIYCARSVDGRSHKTIDLMLALGFKNLILLPGTDDILDRLLSIQSANK